MKDKLWEIDNDPWETYANWESWLTEQMPDFIADKICEIDVTLMANLYVVFCDFKQRIRELEAYECPNCKLKAEMGNRSLGRNIDRIKAERDKFKEAIEILKDDGCLPEYARNILQQAIEPKINKDYDHSGVKRVSDG